MNQSLVEILHLRSIVNLIPFCGEGHSLITFLAMVRWIGERQGVVFLAVSFSLSTRGLFVLFQLPK